MFNDGVTIQPFDLRLIMCGGSISISYPDPGSFGDFGDAQKIPEIQFINGRFYVSACSSNDEIALLLICGSDEILRQCPLLSFVNNCVLLVDEILSGL